MILHELSFLQEQVTKLAQEKKRLEKENRILKNLIRIREEHKRYREALERISVIDETHWLSASGMRKCIEIARRALNGEGS